MIVFVGMETRSKTTRRVTDTRARAILEDACVEAGITRPTHIEVGGRIPSGARVVIALGEIAARWLLPNVEVGAKSVEEMRGYVFDSSVVDAPVILTTHPASVEIAWSPWRTLLSFDLQRAQELCRERLRRPCREVHIISSARESRSAVQDLRRYDRLASDIETRSDCSLACIGFAPAGGRAVVFPAQFLDDAREVLRSPDVTTIWANGIYDLFVLKHRYEVEFGGRVEDCQILWHACYPELAGARENKRKHRFTRKSLSFLASLATFDTYWKGVYSNEAEFFEYNGKDCAITWDAWAWVAKEADRVNAWEVYEHERSLMWPCVDMLARGLRVDDDLRRERISALSVAADATARGVNEIVIPLLERERETLERLESIHLFRETEATCPCCRHASKKQNACWSCAGFEAAPSKAELQVKFGTREKASKAVLEEMLPVCRVCAGAPRETRWTFNANSNEQMKVLLYDVLKLPKRFSRNGKGESTLTVDEQALKGLLAGIAT